MHLRRSSRNRGGPRRRPVELNRLSGNDRGIPGHRGRRTPRSIGRPGAGVQSACRGSRPRIGRGFRPIGVGTTAAARCWLLPTATGRPSARSTRSSTTPMRSSKPRRSWPVRWWGSTLASGSSTTTPGDASRSPSTSWSRSAPRWTPSSSTCWSGARSARSISSRRRTGIVGSGRRSPTSWPRPCRYGHEALAPIAEHVAHALGQAMAGKYVPSTPLTTRRQRSAQAAVKARKAVAKGVATSTAIRQRPTRGASVARWTCPDCGGPVANHRHVRCDACIATDPGQTPETAGPTGAGHRCSEAGAPGVGGGQPRGCLRPRLLPAEAAPEASTGEAGRHRRGGRLLQGLRFRHSIREVHPSRVDVAGTGGHHRPRSVGKRLAGGSKWHEVAAVGEFRPRGLIRVRATCHPQVTLLVESAQAHTFDETGSSLAPAL